MKFALMFFAASDDSLGADKYRLVVDSARFGDVEGFSSVWVPERHFTAFGGLYPNPAVLHAGLATCTSNIRLNAGSVVAPLHHPLRIAEEWSVVDNLSNGRVGLSFASGWNPDDFIFCPDRYATRHDHVLETMQQVQRLWRGEVFEGVSGVGLPARVRMFPAPVQRELPVWLTVAGNPRHFERAGSSGANLLTHLLDQDEDVLASRIALYRNARQAAGFDPSTAIISLMIHTFVGADADLVREQARRPYCDYLKANVGLFKGLAQSRGRDVDLATLPPADLDEFVNFLYDRFAASRGLIGTPDSCAPLVSRLDAIGVTELACLLDFGPDVDLILGNLPHLARLKDLHADRVAAAAPITVPAAPLFNRAAVLARCPAAIPGDEFHRLLGTHGIQIGGAFRAVRTVWRGDGEAVAELLLETEVAGYHVHPASLDACGRILAAALPDLGRAGATSYVPAGFDACDLFAPLVGVVWVHASLAGRSAVDVTAISGDVHVYDTSGRALARLAGLRLVPVVHAEPVAETDVSGLLYERVWDRADLTPAIPDARGQWLVIGDDSGVAAALVRGIEAHGGACVTTAAAVPSGTELRGIVYLRGLDSSVPPDADSDAIDRAVADAVSGALGLAQSSGATPVWLVTRGAVPVPDAAGTTNLAQTPLWGFGRALAVERPGALGALVDLDPDASAEDAARQLLQVMTGSRAEDMVAWRSAARYVPRLTRLDPVARTAPSFACSGDETMLITGGSGGLGLRLAAWLANRGARHVLLCNRHAPDAAGAAEVERLRASGVDIALVQADVADHAALQRGIDEAVSSRAPVTGVFHLAGVLDDGQLGDQTWDRFTGVLAAKVTGAWNLHRLTLGSALKHFVLFSSVASLMPAPGQASYAAANAFLDGLAHHRRGLGLPALAINWGPWSEAGHAQTEHGRQAHARLATLGIGAVSPDVGMRVLDRLLREGRVQAAAVPVDWTRLFITDPSASRLALLAQLREPAVETRQAETAPLLLELAALPEDEQRPYLLQFLSDMVVDALKLRTDEPIDPRQRLFDIGLDSIMALELKDRLERAVGLPLSATLLFVRPTLDALADYIRTECLTTVIEAAMQREVCDL